MIKVQELRHQTVQELREKLGNFKKQLYEFRLQASIGNLEKPHQIRQDRRQIAQILTLLREKELENERTKRTKAST